MKTKDDVCLAIRKHLSKSGVWENGEVIILIGSLFTTHPKIHTSVYVHTPHRFYTYVNTICLYNCSISLLCVCLLLLFHFYCGKQSHKLTFASKTLVRDWNWKKKIFFKPCATISFDFFIFKRDDLKVDKLWAPQNDQDNISWI